LYQFGGNYTAAIQQGEYWRFLSSVFLHNGIFHLFMNMIGLFYGGMLAERILGGKRFLLMYLVAGIAGSVCSYYFHDEMLSVGSSGAVFGIFGFLLGHYFLPGADKELRKAVLVQLVIYVGLNLLHGMKDGIDNWAHAGGLVAGFFIGLAWTFGNTPKEDGMQEAWSFRSGISGTRLFLMPLLLLAGCAFVVQARPRTLSAYMELINQADRYYGQAMRAYPNSEDSAALKKLQDSGIAGWSKVISILDSAAAIPGLDSGRLALCHRFRQAATQRQIAFRYVYRAISEQSPRYYDSVGAAVCLADSLEMRN
jgi:rhomboid protease GluP